MPYYALTCKILGEKILKYIKTGFKLFVLKTFLLSLAIPICSAAQKADAVTLDMKIGQMIMVGFGGLKIDKKNPVVDDIKKRYLGGVILYDYNPNDKGALLNIESPGQVKALIAELKSLAEVPLFIAIDYEGGKVSRLKEKYGFPPTLSHKALGDMDDPKSTFSHASKMYKTLAELGFNLNFAPVVDMETNLSNPVIAKLDRSFSADYNKVKKHALQFIRAGRERGVMSTIKHFPGHGSSDKDSHLGLVDVTKSWHLMELEPFRSLIYSGNADAVMTAHIFNKRLDPIYPATLSRATITGILREKMRYDGVVISDDMQMKAIADNYGLEQAVLKAIEAGVDILLFSKNSDKNGKSIVNKVSSLIRRFVEEGKVSEDRIDSSYKRIMKLKDMIAAKKGEGNEALFRSQDGRVFKGGAVGRETKTP